MPLKHSKHIFQINITYLESQLAAGGKPVDYLESVTVELTTGLPRINPAYAERVDRPYSYSRHWTETWLPMEVRVGDDLLHLHLKMLPALASVGS